MFRRENVITYPNGDFETSMKFLLESVDNEINSYMQRKQEVENLIFMSEATDETIAMFESEEQGFVGKLGQKIIDFWNMIKKKVQELKNMFTSILKKKENTSDADLKKAMESHPELAMSFYDGIRNGNIRLADYKDIDSLLSTAEKLTKEMEQGKLDHKTFSDRIDEGLSKVEKKMVPISNILKAATGIAGAVTSLIFLKKSFIDQNHKYEASYKAYQAKAEEAMKNMADNADDSNSVLKANTAMKKWNAISSMVFGEQSKLITLLEKITSGVGKIAPKSMKSSDKENIEKLANKDKFISNKRRKEIDDEEKTRTQSAIDADRLTKIIYTIKTKGEKSVSDNDWDWYQKIKSSSEAKKMIGGN